MTPAPYLADPDVTLYQGDALDILRELPDESVHMAVTSPPFYGLRDYGTGRWEGGDSECDHTFQAGSTGRSTLDRYDNGLTPETAAQKVTGYGHATYRQTCGKCGATRIDQQIGLEETPEQWVDRLVAVFREVRRVLRSDGTLWLEVGDSYASAPKGNPGALSNGLTNQGRNAAKANAHRTFSTITPGLKGKDLIGAPWMLAFALRADGWYLRSEIIWSKPNPMPESVTDRPTTAHSRIFLLSKSARYFFDQEAVREGYGDPTREWWNEPRTEPGNPNRADGGGIQGRPARGPDGRRATHVAGADGSIQHRDGERWPNPTGRNVRSVWEIATEPFPEAHFATFPQALVRRCILAGTSERGCCPECGAPWVREVEAEYDAQGRTTNGPRSTDRRHESPGRDVRMVKSTTTTGWRPSCECEKAFADAIDRHGWQAPCTILDPFMGSGTTAHVARKLGRRAIGIDLNADYLEMAARRLAQQSLFATEGVTNG